MIFALARRRVGVVLCLLVLGLVAPRGHASQSDRAKAVVVYHGNRESKVFHAPGCQFYHCKNCTAVFNSKEEAAKAGYRPHAGRATCIR